MFILKQSTASQEVLLGPFLDSTDGATAETGLTIANTDIKLWKAGATSEASKNSGGATHIAAGRYYCVLDATDTDTLGHGEINVSVAGALPVRRAFLVLPAVVYDSLIAGSDNLQVDAVQVGGQTASASGTVTFPNATLASTTNITAGTITTVTTVTNQLTAAAIATGVWQDATAGDFTTASSIGKALYTGNVVPGAAGGHFIAGTNAATTITTSLTTTFTGNLTGSVASVTGAVGSVTGNVGGNVAGSVASVTAAVTLPTIPNDWIAAAGIAADAFTAAKFASDVTTEFQSGLATASALATVDDFLDTEIAAILADTNELQTDWVNGGRLDLLLDAVKAKTDNLPASPAATGDIPSAAAIAAAVADEFATASDAVEASPSPTTTEFAGSSSLSSDDDFYNGSVLFFTSGDLDGLARKISDYTGSTRLITLSPALPAAPSSSVTFRIIGRID